MEVDYSNVDYLSGNHFRPQNFFLLYFFLHKDSIIDVNFGHFIHKCVINSLVVHPEIWHRGRRKCLEGRTLAAIPVILPSHLCIWYWLYSFYWKSLCCIKRLHWYYSFLKCKNSLRKRVFNLLCSSKVFI